MIRNEGNRQTCLICALLLVATLLTFWPATRCDFIYFDDPDYVTENGMVKKGLSAEGVRWALTTAHSSNWHPLTWLSHMLDVTLYGLAPAGHHATSILLHSVNVVLLFLLFQRMTGALWRSASLAALFAVHPLRVESVVWVSERKDVLCAFFGLLTLIAYAAYARAKAETGRARHSVRADGEPLQSRRAPVLHSIAEGGRSDAAYRHPLSSRWYWLALVCFALGLMSKPMLVTWPFVMLLLDYWPLRRLATCDLRSANLRSIGSFVTQHSALLGEKLPFFALAVASCVTTFAAQKAGGAVTSLLNVPLGDRLENAGVAYGAYLGKMIWPTNMALVYPYRENIAASNLVVAAAVLIGISLITLAQARRRPYLAVGWAWYLGILVPVIGLVQVGDQAMADRYTYLPSIGILFAVAWGTRELMELKSPRRLLITVAALLLLIGWVVVTQRQITHWKDGEAIFKHTLRVTTGNYVAHNLLATTLAQQGRLEEATEHYREAIRILPRYADAYNNLGFSLAKVGRHAEAEAHYIRALELRPAHNKAIGNLALSYMAQGKYAEAERCYETLTARQKTDPDTLFNLANAQYGQGKLPEAAGNFRRCLALSPSDAEAEQQLGLALIQLGQVSEGIDHLRQASERRPDANSQYRLALALTLAGRTAEAIAAYRRALELRPDWPVALNELAWLLATHPEPAIRNGAEAVRLAERACALGGDSEPRYWGTLDAAYAEAGRFDEAVRTAQKTLELALAKGQTNLATAAQQRLDLYRANQPYRPAR